MSQSAPKSVDKVIGGLPIRAGCHNAPLHTTRSRGVRRPPPSQLRVAPMAAT
jgi:hypothetical protein